MKCACLFENREEFDGRPPVVVQECGYHACRGRDGARPDHRFMHEWHVAINAAHWDGAKWTEPRLPYMYAGKDLADEVPRMVVVLRSERTGKLPQSHRQCSHSDAEQVPDNHLTCCLGVECRKCPALLALDRAKLTPEQIDVAKAWTCAAHIMRDGGNADTSEGFLLTTDDRMYWDRVYSNLSMGTEQDVPDGTTPANGVLPTNR